MTETQMQVIRWLAHGQTGMSSETMAFWLGFGVKKFDSFGFAYPHDGGDLGRCLKLLELAPGLREKVPEMASLSPEWAALVARWTDLVAAHKRSRDEVYELLQSILHPIEDQRGDTVRVSKNVTMQISGRKP